MQHLNSKIARDRSADWNLQLFTCAHHFIKQQSYTCYFMSQNDD